MQFSYIDILIFLLLFHVSRMDLLHHRIGKAETYLLSVLGIIYNGDALDSFTGGAVCSVIPETVNLLVSDLTGLGGGDIRLMFAAGCLLGVDGGLCALLISGILMLFAAGIYCILKKRDPAGLQLPYGPFLSAGIILILLKEILAG